MKYYIFIQNNKIIGAGQAQLLNEDINTLEVSEEIYNAFCEDNDKVIYDVENNTVILNPDYEQVLYNRREVEFNKAFFETSLGHVRRKATMTDGTQKDFISDLLPLMEGTVGIPIIVYDKPDFSKEVTEEVLIGLQRVVQSTAHLVQECKNQAIIDFYGYNPINLLNQQQQEDLGEEDDADETPVIDDEDEDINLEEESSQYNDEDEYIIADEDDIDEEDVDNLEE